MKEIETLDFILETLYKERYKDKINIKSILYKDKVKDEKVKFDAWNNDPKIEQDVIRLRNKLLKDDFAEYFVKTEEQEDFELRITFDGILHWKKDGYIGQLKRISNQATRQSITIWLIAVGTSFAGLYALSQFFRWMYNVISCPY